MSGLRKYLTLGLGHGINDGISGYVIGVLLFQDYSPLEIGIYALLYNLLAFGGQLLFANLYEQWYKPKTYLMVSMGLLMLALAGLQYSALFAVIAAGIASAIVHITGGSESTRDDDRAFGLGWFAAPGVVGLIGGGILAHLEIDILEPGLLISLMYLVLIWRFYSPGKVYPGKRRRETELENHDVIMVILITIIGLRSFLWDAIILAEQGDYSSLMLLAGAAMVGKVAGGYLADRVGHKKYTLIALILSLPLLTLLKRNIVAFLMGVALLQSTISSTTAMVVKVVRSKPALGIALTFGVPILVAISLFSTPWAEKLGVEDIAWVAVPVSVGLVFVYSVLKKARGKKERENGNEKENENEKEKERIAQYDRVPTPARLFRKVCQSRNLKLSMYDTNDLKKETKPRAGEAL